jgi:Protein of unknown function (DUF1236)
MRHKWMSSMLAATAAAALVAGVTFASAQAPGGGQHMRQGPASGGGHAQMQGRGGGFNQSSGRALGSASHAQTGRSFGPSHAQTSHSFGPQHAMRSERSASRGHAAVQTRNAQSRHAAAPQRSHRGQALAEQRRMHGQNLKTTSGTTKQTGTAKQTGTRNQRGTKAFAQAGTQSKVSLTSQQRARIHNVVLHRDFSRLRVRNVDFDIRIGVVVPRSFHLFVIPEDIVFIVPEFRHFRCFFFDDELVIVDPVTFEIVAVIPV